MKTDRQLREEIASNRRLLRERKRKALGLSGSEHRTYSRDGHEYLYGILAKTQRRIEVFEAAGGIVTWFDKSDPSTVEEIQPAICQGCAEPHYLGWNDGTGEWHHNVKSHGGKRCDCAACGLFVCPMIHEFYRNKVIPILVREPQFGASRKVEAT